MKITQQFSLLRTALQSSGPPKQRVQGWQYLGATLVVTQIRAVPMHTAMIVEGTRFSEALLTALKIAEENFT